MKVPGTDASQRCNLVTHHGEIPRSEFASVSISFVFPRKCFFCVWVQSQTVPSASNGFQTLNSLFSLQTGIQAEVLCACTFCGFLASVA